MPTKTPGRLVRAVRLAVAGRTAGAVRLSAVTTASALLLFGPVPAAGSQVPALASRAHERGAGLFHDGGVLAYGAARFFGSPAGASLAAPVVAMATAPDGNGYWLAGADGAVLAYGDARYYGGMASAALPAPVIDMAASPGGLGYWLVAADGEVFAFGDAGYYGSAADLGLAAPIVGFAPTWDGRGYWLVSDDGGVYNFGDARYLGSLGATNLHRNPVVAIAASVDGQGYWLVQGGGEVHPYGDVPDLGGIRGHPPVDGIAVTSDGQGYWLVCDDGEVDALGDAPYLGGNNTAEPRPPIAGIVADDWGQGYWLLDAEDFPVRFRPLSPGLGPHAVQVAASQLGPSRDGGNYCNPYGPCEQWCALFATWVWERVGVPVPRYAFAGDVYKWAARHKRAIPASARPAPGDLVFYGRGPWSTASSPHMGVVAQVWPDGEIDTVEGDAGPGSDDWTAVLVNGPYPPALSLAFNAMPIYAFAVP